MPTLTGFTPAITFAENTVNATPQLLDGDVVFTDAEGDFDGGTLTLSGLLAEDRASIRNQGTGAGQISLSGSNVTFGGVTIGTLAGGVGGTLTITFNASATSAAVDALIQNLTYANVSDTPTATRTLALNVTDAAGNDLGALPGTASFTERTGAANPFNGVDVGSASAAFFADLNGDGDLDAVVGQALFGMYYFENTGTATTPVFTARTGSANPFTDITDFNNQVPIFGDLDGDGDRDAVIGDQEGFLHYFRNTGSATVPSFTQLTGAGNPFNGHELGVFSRPAFGDLDGDGDMDVMAGNGSGILTYFENTGTTAVPAFTLRSGALNPFNGVDVGGRSSPAFTDMDNDGDLDALVGERDGFLLYFENTGTAAAPTFTLRTGAANPFNAIDVGGDAIPTFADLDGDGDLDALIGEASGTLNYFENTTARGAAAAVTVTAESDGATALDDAFGVGETATLSGDVFANNGSGADSGTPLTVTAVNGVGASVGSQITLASGALLTLNANGTFSYDPNGAFAHLPGPASGGTNPSATDSFTYTVTGGDTAAVTVTLTGVDTSGDLVLGSAGADTLLGGSGDDTLQGRGGNDTLNGEAGTDTADYSAAAGGVNARLNLGLTGTDGDGGFDLLVSIENLTGSGFNDLLVGTNAANVLSGGTGFDTLIGLGGHDTLIGGTGAGNEMIGGAGDDTYVVTASDTLVELAGQGTDSVQTDRTTYVLKTHFENLLYTGSSAFRGTGNAANNTVEGGAGNDVLIGRGGSDLLDGNSGIDTADYAAAVGAVVADLGAGAASQDGDGGSDALSEIENLIGSAFADQLTGDGFANLLGGGSGDDVLAGRGGNDILRGGGGTDTADYRAAAGGVTIKLALNVASNDGDGGADTFNGIENVTGSAFNDTISGDALANVIRGGLGGDTLIGLGGADTLIGGTGAANELFGGAGDDTFVVDANDTIVEVAGQGTDTVQTTRNAYILAASIENLTFTGSGVFTGTGNAEANVMTGGLGADVLTGGMGNDTLNGGQGRDTAVMSGASFEYTVEDLGLGQFRITDTVAGRDGVDILNGVEEVRYANGVTGILIPGGAPAPALSDKDGDEPQVLPGLADDDFLLAKDGDLPLVLPGDFDGLEERTTPQVLTRTDDLAVTIDQDGGLVSGDGWAGRDGHDPWLM